MKADNTLTPDCREAMAIVLPSLDPDAKFGAVVEGLVACGFRHIVIVDDGSCEERQCWFEKAAAHPQCTVIHHGSTGARAAR